MREHWEDRIDARDGGSHCCLFPVALRRRGLCICQSGVHFTTYDCGVGLLAAHDGAAAHFGDISRVCTAHRIGDLRGACAFDRGSTRGIATPHGRTDVSGSPARSEGTPRSATLLSRSTTARSGGAAPARVRVRHRLAHAVARMGCRRGDIRGRAPPVRAHSEYRGTDDWNRIPDRYARSDGLRLSPRKIR